MEKSKSGAEAAARRASAAKTAMQKGKRGTEVVHAAQGTFPLPLDTQPMEARSAAVIPRTDGPWQYEPKWDGFRCLAFKMGEHVELRAKSGKSLTRYFPEIAAFLTGVKAPCFVIDGELVIEQKGRLSFDALQMRLHPAQSRITKLSMETPARFVAFDMLANGKGESLLLAPLRRRRQELEALLRQAGRSNSLVLSPKTSSLARAETWLKDARRGSTDGIVAKLLDEPYHPGERWMVKVKWLRTADCVIGGFRYQSDSRKVGSLLLGLYNAEGKLDHVGFTVTIAEAERRALTRKLKALRQAPGFTGRAPGGPSRWSTERSGEWEPVRPELVVEVRFDHVTGDRFRHGTKLMRWRPDKSPRQCTFEQIRNVTRAGPP